MCPLSQTDLSWGLGRLQFWLRQISLSQVLWMNESEMRNMCLGTNLKNEKWKCSWYPTNKKTCLALIPYPDPRPRWPSPSLSIWSSDFYSCWFPHFLGWNTHAGLIQKHVLSSWSNRSKRALVAKQAGLTNIRLGKFSIFHLYKYHKYTHNIVHEFHTYDMNNKQRRK